jgi:hypothetical protein
MAIVKRILFLRSGIVQMLRRRFNMLASRKQVGLGDAGSCQNLL